jgi:hypothetical protein
VYLLVEVNQATLTLVILDKLVTKKVSIVEVNQATFSLVRLDKLITKVIMTQMSKYSPLDFQSTMFWSNFQIHLQNLLHMIECR